MQHAGKLVASGKKRYWIKDLVRIDWSESGVSEGGEVEGRAVLSYSTTASHTHSDTLSLSHEHSLRRKNRLQSSTETAMSLTPKIYISKKRKYEDMRPEVIMTRSVTCRFALLSPYLPRSIYDVDLTVIHPRCVFTFWIFVRDVAL